MKEWKVMHLEGSYWCSIMISRPKVLIMSLSRKTSYVASGSLCNHGSMCLFAYMYTYERFIWHDQYEQISRSRLNLGSPTSMGKLKNPTKLNETIQEIMKKHWKTKKTKKN